MGLRKSKCVIAYLIRTPPRDEDEFFLTLRGGARLSKQITRLRKTEKTLGFWAFSVA